MKSSGKGGKRKNQVAKCLIVDGYNVIGQLYRSALTSIKDIDSARHRLVDLLADYASFYGEDVILVFDAQNTAMAVHDDVSKGVRIIFTSRQETADERIERLVYELRDVYREILVATSDYAEQQVTFGGGALRISATEFLRKMDTAKREIRDTVRDIETNKGSNRTVIDSIRQDVANILEKWRRQ